MAAYISKKKTTELPPVNLIKELAEIKSEFSIQFDNLQNNIDEQFKEQTRALRRIGITQKQQLDDQDSIKQELSSIRKEMLQNQGTTLTLSQGFKLLDQLDKIAVTVQNNEVALNLINDTHLDLLEIFAIEPLVEIGSTYPDEGCTISAAIQNADLPEGTILEIIQQGYINYEEELLREAVVVVSKNYQETGE